MFGTSPRCGGIAPSTLSLPRTHLAQGSGQSLRTIVREMNISRTQIVCIPIRAPDYHRKSACLSLCHGRSEVFFVAGLNKHIMSAAAERALPAAKSLSSKSDDHEMETPRSFSRILEQIQRLRRSSTEVRCLRESQARTRQEKGPTACAERFAPANRSSAPGRWIAI